MTAAPRRRLRHLADTLFPGLRAGPQPVASSTNTTTTTPDHATPASAPDPEDRPWYGVTGTQAAHLPLLATNNDEYRESLKGAPRLASRTPEGVDNGYDMSNWTTLELLRRAQSLGATEEQLNSCLEVVEGSGSTVPRTALLKLVQSLEPPPPETAKIEDLTLEAKTASVEEMLERLHRFGAVVLRNALDPALLATVDAQIEQEGGWAEDPKDRVHVGDGGRAGMDLLLHCPALEQLYTHPLVYGCAKALMAPYCRRVAMKEIVTFAVHPGQGKQVFHREDNFWPWHHEPHPWACSVLWAIDEFTPENGGTRILPFSHLARIREAGKEMLEDSYDESQVLKVAMPRGSVLIFTGGLVHAGGENTTKAKRKTVLHGYQLGWLRPENKFYAYKPLHDALVAGQFSDEMATLLGHADRSHKNEGWSGSRRFDHYNGLRPSQSKTSVDGEEQRPHLYAQKGFEPIG